MSKLKEWFTQEGKLTSIVIAIMCVSVFGTVAGSVYNAASVNNLTESVSAVNRVYEQVKVNQEVTLCRTSVQADYDSALASLFGQQLSGEVDEVEDFGPELVERFSNSIKELDLLRDQKICVPPDVNRAPIDVQNPRDG